MKFGQAIRIESKKDLNLKEMLFTLRSNDNTLQWWTLIKEYLLIEIKGQINSDMDLSNSKLTGLMVGNATVLHGRSILDGLLTGILTISSGAEVEVNGLIKGGIVNNGQLHLTGLVLGIVANSDTASFSYSDGAIFPGRNL